MQQAGEKRLRALIENSSDAILLLDPRGTILKNTPHTGRVLGYRDEELFGRNAADLVHPDARERTQKKLAELLVHPERSVAMEFRAQHLNGSWRWIEAMATNLLADPHIRAIVVNYRDITERKKADEKLRESEERHRLIAELSSDYSYTCRVDAEGNAVLESVTEGFIKVIGYTLQEVEERGGWTCFVHPDDVMPIFEKRQVWLRGQRSEGEMRIISKQGEIRWIRYSVLPVWDEAKQRVVRLLGAGQDITNQRRTEETLQRLVRQHRLILAAAGEGIYGLDLQGNTTFVNPAAAQMIGWEMGELIGKPLHCLIHHSRADGSPYPIEECAILQSLKDGIVHSVTDELFWRKDGTAFHVEYISTPIWEDGQIVGAVVTFKDISERKKNDQRFLENAERLRILSRRLLEIQEQERRHLARELHDEIGQELTGLKLTLEMTARRPAEQIQAGMDKALSQVRDLTARVRDLSLQLRPSMLDDLGLLSALLWHVQRYTDQTGIHVAFEHVGLDRRLFPPEVETAAFRIIQEALTNVARHARVVEVTVRICLDQNLLFVLVEDHGLGFDPRAVSHGANSGGLGGMRERAALLGGYLVVDSEHGSGTRVVAEFPVVGAEERRRHAFDPIAGR